MLARTSLDASLWNHLRKRCVMPINTPISGEDPIIPHVPPGAWPSLVSGCREGIGTASREIVLSIPIFHAPLKPGVFPTIIPIWLPHSLIVIEVPLRLRQQEDVLVGTGGPVG